MGRKSLNDYPPEWPEVAQAVKDAANWECIRCEHPHDTESGYMLTVHHLDLDKSNLAWWNLAALCQRCHLRIQGKVIMERIWFLEHSPWFIPYVAGYYAAQRAQSEGKEVTKDYNQSLTYFSKEWIAKNAADLIFYGQGLIGVHDVA